MSENNIEIVRRYVEVQNGPPDAVRAAVRTLWDGDAAAYYPIGKFPESRPCHGVGEICEFIGRFREAWSNVAFTIHRLVEVDDDRVLACTTLRASGRESEMKLETDLCVSAWLRHGRLTRVEDHLTIKGGLRALGLDAEALHAAGLEK
jgi:SnoaL-like domain